ncbi:BTB domain-containing protein [Pleurotus pulmonarius]
MQSDVPKATFPRNADYYFNNVIFLVDNELFNVPRHKFQSESAIFRSMFDLPPGDETPDGLTDEQPLRLDGIDRVEFCSLLKYLYPRGIEGPRCLTLAEWLAVLKQSGRWEMDRIRNDAIETIPTLVADPAQWLGLAIDYDVEAWFIPAMNKLVQRAEPVSMVDLSHIGIECALKIAAIREVCWGGCISPQAARGAVIYDCKDRIQQEFKDYLTTSLLLADKVLTTPDVNEAEIPSEPSLPTTSKMSGLRKKKKTARVTVA